MNLPVELFRKILPIYGMKNDKGLNILVLGISGMLGNAVFRYLNANSGHKVFGSARSGEVRRFFDVELHGKIITGIDAENHEALIRIFADVKPNIVINCIGIVKQLKPAENALVSLPINSLLPHRLANLCKLCGARLIHISTDCVFSGKKGNYLESDKADAEDMYGQSKLLGEVYYSHSITLRTSIIGREIGTARSLIGWFLAQESPVNGYKNAIFSGLPTVEIARIIQDYVIVNPLLNGLYHVSADPISKYELLKKVADVFRKSIRINPDTKYCIDRSLNSERFKKATSFTPKGWGEMIQTMYAFDYK